jgi:hypothetical protein
MHTCHYIAASVLSQAQQKINAACTTSPKDECPRESCIELVVGMVDEQQVKQDMDDAKDIEANNDLLIYRGAVRKKSPSSRM